MTLFRTFALALVVFILGEIRGQAQASYAGQLAGWSFHALTGGRNNFGASPLAPTASEANVTVTGLTRGSGVAIGGAAAARGWGGYQFNATSASAAIAAGEYITCAISAKTGYALSLSSLSPIDYLGSSSGPTSGLFQYQIGGGPFVDIATLTYTNVGTPGAALGGVDLTGIPALQNLPAGATVTFRLVNWGASSSVGPWYLYDVSDTTAVDFAIQGTLINNAFQVAYDAGPGFFGGENLIITNVSGIALGVWSSPYGALSVTNWYYEGAMQEQSLGNSQSRYSFNIQPDTSPMYYIVAATNVCNYTPTEAVTTVTTEDYAEFTVLSSNVTITAGGVFSLATPATIVASPGATNVFAGQDVSLSVEAAGSGTAGFQWWENASPLTNSATVSGAQTGQLNFTPAATNQSGNYFVVFTNNLGGATSSAALFNVVPLPTLAVSNSPNGLALSASGGAVNDSYIVESATNLTPPVVWSAVQTNVVGPDGGISFTGTNGPGGVTFYRLAIP